MSKGKRVILRGKGGRQFSISEAALAKAMAESQGSEAIAATPSGSMAARAQAYQAGLPVTEGDFTVNFDLTGHATEANTGVVLYDANKIVRQQVSFTETPTTASNSFGAGTTSALQDILALMAGNNPHVIKGVRLVTSDKSVFTGEVKFYHALPDGSVMTKTKDKNNTLSPGAEQGHIYDWGAPEGSYSGSKSLGIVADGFFAMSFKIPPTKTVSIAITLGAVQRTVWGS